MSGETIVEIAEIRNDLTLRDGVELLPENDGMLAYRVDEDDKMHIERYNATFDQAFLASEHFVEVNYQKATRWVQEVNVGGREVMLSRTEFNSGVVTRSAVFKQHHTVVSTIIRSDGWFAERHQLHNIEDKIAETDVAPLNSADYSAIRHLDNDLQQRRAA